MSVKSLYKVFIVLITIGLLSACGGGGGGDDATTESTSGGTPPSISPTSLTFNAVAGGPAPATQYIIVSGFSDELRLTPLSGSMPSWLRVTNTSGGSIPFGIDVDIISTSLNPGTYTETLRFDNVQTFPTTEVIGYQDVVVTYVVDESLTISNTELGYNVVSGSTAASSAQTISLFGGSLDWTAVVDNSWLDISKTSGTTPDTLDIALSAQAASLGAGSYSGTVTITSSSTGETRVVDVSLNVEAHRLFVPDKAVAFSKLPSRSYLSHSIEIKDNGGIPTNWTAQDDANWLSLVSSSGSTDGTLTLVADPSGLTDGVHYASVTIAPDSEPSVANSEIVRVALYVSSTDAAASTTFTVSGIDPTTVGKSSLIADPLRPYFYMTTAAADIAIYHAYTQALVNTITVSNAEFHDLTISADGSTLYAANYSDLSIAVIDLDTQSISQTFTGPYFAPCGSCADYANSHKATTRYFELNGYPLLVTNSLEIIDATDGTLLDAIPGPASINPLMVATDAEKGVIYAAAVSSSLNELHRYEVGYSYITGVGFYYARTNLVEFLGYMKDLEILADGSHMCAPLSGTKFATCFTTSDLSAWQDLATAGYALNLDVGPTGKIYITYNSPGGGIAFNSDGSPLSISLNVGSTVDSDQLAISGDGMRLISRGYDSYSTSTRTVYLNDIEP